VRMDDPRAADYRRIAPGETLSGTADLRAAGYPIDAPGTYDIAFTRWLLDAHVDDGRGPDPRPRLRLRGATLPCNTVTVTVRPRASE